MVAVAIAAESSTARNLLFHPTAPCTGARYLFNCVQALVMGLQLMLGSSYYLERRPASYHPPDLSPIGAISP